MMSEPRVHRSTPTTKASGTTLGSSGWTTCVAGAVDVVPPAVDVSVSGKNPLENPPKLSGYWLGTTGAVVGGTVDGAVGLDGMGGIWPFWAATSAAAAVV